MCFSHVRMAFNISGKCLAAEMLQISALLLKGAAGRSSSLREPMWTSAALGTPHGCPPVTGPCDCCLSTVSSHGSPHTTARSKAWLQLGSLGGTHSAPAQHSEREFPQYHPTGLLVPFRGGSTLWLSPGGTVEVGMSQPPKMGAKEKESNMGWGITRSQTHPTSVTTRTTDVLIEK